MTRQTRIRIARALLIFALALDVVCLGLTYWSILGRWHYPQTGALILTWCVALTAAIASALLWTYPG